ncbi:hypothetical protein [Lactiplantibacillus plantarum]
MNIILKTGVKTKVINTGNNDFEISPAGHTLTIRKNTNNVSFGADALGAYRELDGQQFDSVHVENDPDDYFNIVVHVEN